MRSTWILLVLAALLSASGIFISDKLLAKHLHAPGQPEWLNALCESGDSGKVSCDTVLASRWGMFPPVREGEPEGTAHTPVALIGMGYFTALLAWTLVVGRPNRLGRYWHLVPLTVNACGVVASIGFVKVMALELSTWCPLCVGSHVVNALLLVVHALLWPPKTGATAGGGKRAAGASPAYPSVRLAVAAGALCLFLPALEIQMASTAALRRANAQLTAAMDAVRADVGSMISMHLNGAKKHIDIRPDDPVRHNGVGLPTIVVFSDFECGACRKFAKAFEEKHRQAFGGNIRVVYKHYPLCSDCNAQVKRRAHPNACKAAELAEAARMVGGNAKFWEAHDLFFGDQKALATMTVEKLAAALKLDVGRLTEAMNSQAVKDRIAQDVIQATALGVKSTPSVFLNGRLVNSWARRVDKFWLQLGAAYETQRLRNAAKAQSRKGPSP